MNVFVLCTGRCGSMTFINAAGHIKNYSAGHETRTKLLGLERFNYPTNHIEADNRLSWLLGRLESAYGDNAYYVHLKRSEIATAQSFVKRYEGGIMKAYRGNGIVMGLPENSNPMAVALDYCNTVNSNICHFLANKSQVINVSLENGKTDFEKFWQLIGAEGDIDKALAEFDVKHNASKA